MKSPSHACLPWARATNLAKAYPIHRDCDRIVSNYGAKTLSILFPAAFAHLATAQPKPTLTPADYGKWETLGQATLSADGNLAHEIRRTDGNNDLCVASMAATAAVAAGGKTHVIAFCSGAAFSADSRWLACEATVSESEQDRLRKTRRPAQTKLAVLDLANAAVIAIDDVQSFAFSSEDQEVAFRRYGPARQSAAATDAPATGRGGGGGRGGAGRGGTGAGADGNDPTGSALTIRNLETGVDTTFGDVTSYAWQDKGTDPAQEWIDQGVPVLERERELKGSGGGRGPVGTAGGN
jgi:hypothetical protein